MRITARQLRQIIRETLHESSEPSLDKSSQDLSASQKIKYAAAINLLGAVPSSAKRIATGEEDILPTPGEALSLAWNSKITDWTLTTLGAIADAIPVYGIPISIGVAQVQIVKAAAAADWLGVAFGTIAMYPGVGDAIAAFGRLVKQGKQVSSDILKALLKAMASVSDNELQSALGKIAFSINDPDVRRKIQANVSNVVKAKNEFVKDLRQSIPALA